MAAHNHYKLLLIDDDPRHLKLFRDYLFAPANPLIADVDLITSRVPLATYDEYYQYDFVALDYHLKLFEPNGEELTGYRVAQRIHFYQYEEDGAGNRLRSRRASSLMLLTGSHHGALPIDTRDYVDQIAYKIGFSDRHVDDALGCLHAMLRSRANV